MASSSLPEKGNRDEWMYQGFIWSYTSLNLPQQDAHSKYKKFQIEFDNNGGPIARTFDDYKDRLSAAARRDLQYVFNSLVNALQPS
jgi:hypothetical protein